MVKLQDKFRKSVWMLWALACTAFSETYEFTVEEGIEIPNIGPAMPVEIFASGIEGTVVDMELTLVGFRHGYIQETALALSNPAGLTTLLVDGVRCRLYSPADVGFSDRALGHFGTNCASGLFLPGEEVLTRDFSLLIAPKRPFFVEFGDLLKDDPNGRWVFWAEDYVSGDGGEIASFVLKITTE